MNPNVTKWIKDNKFPLMLFAALLILLIAVFVVHKFYSSQFIKLMYDSGFFRAAVNQNIDYQKEAEWFIPDIMKNLFTTSFFFILVLIITSVARFKNWKCPEIRPMEWFYLTAGLFLTQWYSWEMEDSYIFLRYVDNLLFLKNGLVYNRGEYVEGFSSPFMVMLLTLLRAAERSWMQIFRLITAMSFIFFWFMLVKLDRRLSPAAVSINFPLAYLTFNYGVLSHFSSRMETPITQVIAVAYALYILNPASWVLQVILAISPLVRHELILPFVFCSVLTWRYHKTFPLKMIFMMIFLVGSWVLFRIYYYADLLPNTFYLKNMVSIKQGFIYIHNVFGTYHFYEISALFLIFIYLLKKRDVELELSRRVMMIITALPIVLYVVKIGGDWTHYRYLAFPFVLMACSLSGIFEHYIHRSDLAKYKSLLLLTGIVLSVVFFSLYPPQLVRHPFFLSSSYDTIPEENTRRKFLSNNLNIEEAASRAKLGKRTTFNYTTDPLKQIKKINMNKALEYDEIEIGLWCQEDYEHFYRRIIHGWGLTDAILARIEVSGTIGHKLVFPLAEDLLQIYKSSEYIGIGMYRKAVEEGRAPEWIIKNLDTIEIIERKIYNKHEFLENLKLAFTFPPKIKP